MQLQEETNFKKNTQEFSKPIYLFSVNFHPLNKFFFLKASVLVC